MTYGITLPYPPSVNHYWIRGKKGSYLSKKAKEFKQNVSKIVEELRKACAIADGPMEGDIRIHVDVHPPDKRHRDIDNLLKAVLDVLQSSGIYGDDFQVAKITIVRMACVPGGKVVVTVQDNGKVQ